MTVNTPCVEYGTIASASERSGRSRRSRGGGMGRGLPFVALAALCGVATVMHGSMHGAVIGRGDGVIGLLGGDGHTKSLGLGLVGKESQGSWVDKGGAFSAVQALHSKPSAAAAAGVSAAGDSGDLRVQAERLSVEEAKLRLEEEEVRSKQRSNQERLLKALRDDGKRRGVAAAAPRLIPDGKVPGYLSNAQKSKVMSEYGRAVSNAVADDVPRDAVSSTRVQRLPAQAAVQAAVAARPPEPPQRHVSKQPPSPAASGGAAKGASAHGKIKGRMPWQDGMGTDISFIATTDYPLSMVGGGHVRHPALTHPAARALIGQEQQGRHRMHNVEMHDDVHNDDTVGAPPPSQHGIAPGHQWTAPMGTDIAFINTLDYPGSMIGAEHASHASQGDTTRVAASTSGLASRVAKLVLSKLEPQLDKGRRQMDKSGGGQGKLRVARRVSKLSLSDYGLSGDDELRMEQHFRPVDDQNWTHPEFMGSPCSVSGNCNHGSMRVNNPLAVRERFLERYFAEGEDGNGHTIESEDGQDAVEDEPKEEEDTEEEDESKVPKLGNNLLMRNMDDFVTPDDAYAHNELTSGAEGFDHFGHFAPHSEENQRILYGSAFEGNHSFSTQDVFGVDPHPVPTRGSIVQNIIGDHQVGGSDIEVNLTEARAMVPGLVRDRLGNLSSREDSNQRLINGKYYRLLRRDGILDRETPVDEARAQMWAASHDRQPLPDLALGDWNMGFGRSSTSHDTSHSSHQSWERAREEVHGEDWRDKVNTGTHEQIEKGLGVARNMDKEGAYFKGGGGVQTLTQFVDNSLSNSIRF